jgi:hypothetical protein
LLIGAGGQWEKRVLGRIFGVLPVQSGRADQQGRERLANE